MKRFTITAITLLSMIATTTFAGDKKPDNAQKAEAQSASTESIRGESDFQKIIDEYKEYVSKIPVSTRDEVIAYRKEVAKLNKEKRLMYKKLSQESQDYLKKEQEYKRKLPLNKKGLINAETMGESTDNN